LIPYTKLLETEEWEYKRMETIIRDNEECTICKSRNTDYIYGKHIFVRTHFIGVKKPNKKFWQQWDYFEQRFGDQFTGMKPSEDDYDIVPEEVYEAVTLNKQHYLQVHHKYYIWGKLPWQYNNDALITLCNWCHFALHQNERIPFFIEKENTLIEKKLTLCLRCNGAGFLPEFNYVQNGICFRCQGAKYEELI